MAIGDPLTEATFLRDVHRKSMQWHIEYLTELNESIEKISQHTRTAVARNQANDQDGAQAISRVQKA